MNERSKKLDRWQVFFILYFIGVIIIHLQMTMNFGDDLTSKQLNAGYSVLDWVIHRYNTWSARFIQEATAFYLIWHPILWKVINIIIMVTLPCILARLIDAENKDKYFCVFVFLLYPIIDMKSAGWICTTITYLWPAYFGLLVCLYLKCINEDKRLNVFQVLMFFIVLIIACNHELLAVLLLMIMGYYTVCYFINNKKINKLMICAIVLDILNIIFILASPGNVIRKEQETINWFAQYANYKLIDKVYIGVVHTYRILVEESNPIFILMCFCIVIGVFKYCNKVWEKCIGVVPISSVFLLKTIIPQYIVGDVVDINYANYLTYIPMVLAIVMLISITISIICIYSNSASNQKEEMIFAIVLLYGGLSTQAVMGFSPTIYASGNRTATFMYFSFIYVCLLLYKRIYIFNESHTKLYITKDDNSVTVDADIFAFLAVLAYLCNLFMFTLYA